MGLPLAWFSEEHFKAIVKAVLSLIHRFIQGFSGSIQQGFDNMMNKIEKLKLK